MARDNTATQRSDAAASAPNGEGNGWWLQLLIWREKHVPEKTFVVMLALIIGTASGLAAVLLKTLIGLIAGFLTNRFDIERDNLLYLVFPAIGILLASLYVY